MNLEEMKIPKHVAIIVDGHGRWAKERGLSRSKGHDAGFNNLLKLIVIIIVFLVMSVMILRRF